VKGAESAAHGAVKVMVMVMAPDRRRDALTQDVFNMSDIKNRYVLPPVFGVAWWAAISHVPAAVCDRSPITSDDVCRFGRLSPITLVLP
jgi:hypothetical protein